MHPVKHTVFRKYLDYCGCRFLRSNGGHEIWTKKGLLRPITFPVHGKEKKQISSFYISSNLRTLGVSKNHFLQWLEENV